jgi:hypothetical protein
MPVPFNTERNAENVSYNPNFPPRAPLRPHYNADLLECWSSLWGGRMMGTPEIDPARLSEDLGGKWHRNYGVAP